MLVGLPWKSNFLSPNVEKSIHGDEGVSLVGDPRVSCLFLESPDSMEYTFVGCLPSTKLILGKVLRCEEQTDMVLMKFVKNRQTWS